MAEQQHNCGISLSPTSDNDSSDHHTGGGPSGGSSAHRVSPSSGDHHLIPAMTPPQKKPRGRPPGSKNKPKPPVVITQENEDSMKPVVIEVIPGSDVVDTLINFARRRHVSISVLSGTGTIANVTLRHPLPHAPCFTLHGPFTMLSLTGSYLSGSFTPSTTSPPLVSASSSSSSNPAPYSSVSWPPCSSFGITLSGAQGQIFGGVVGGKIVAANGVFVVATIFKKHLFHKVDGNGNGDEGDQDNNNNNNGGGGSGNGDQGGNETMSGFNVASPVPLNCQAPSDVNVMQWGHGHSSSRPANY